MSRSNIDALNDELQEMGLDPIKDVDEHPERTAYYEHLNMPAEERDKGWVKLLKYLEEAYMNTYQKTVASAYPYLLFERDEDKTYWLYSDETGIYSEINFTMVRALVLRLLIDEGFEKKATEAFAKNVLARYRAAYPERGHHYDDFDSDPVWFHTANGWVNVKTLTFEEHTPLRLSRRASAVSYDAEAVCPTYDAFLDEMIQIPKDQVRAIDQFSGLLLTPDITRQKMLVIIGKPGSGKSTLLDCWSDVLGDTATQVGLHEIASESFRFRGSSLVGKQLCWFDEVEVTRSEMGNSLIQLVTGQHIRVERKGINGIISAQNRLKCVLTANTLPRSAEMGIYRRMILVYFNYSFYDNMTANHNIREVLKNEASGILNRMLKGLADLTQNDGFTIVDGHDELIEEYKTSSNTVAEFLDEYFVFDETAPPISSKALLEAYKVFSGTKYAESLTPQRFGLMLKTHGLMRFDKIYSKKDMNNGTKVWCGLRLKDWYVFNTAGFIRAKEDF